MDKCPICGSEQKREYTDMMDGHILMEYEDVCPNGHWSYLFVTGYAEEIGYNTIVSVYSYHRKYALNFYEAVKRKVLLFVFRLRWKLEKLWG